jgi:hypothetical protein
MIKQLEAHPTGEGFQSHQFLNPHIWNYVIITTRRSVLMSHFALRKLYTKPSIAASYFNKLVLWRPYLLCDRHEIQTLCTLFLQCSNSLCLPVSEEKIYYTSFEWRNVFPENSIWNTTEPLLSYSCMFQVEICFQQLEIWKSVCMFIVLAIIVETD